MRRMLMTALAALTFCLVLNDHADAQRGGRGFGGGGMRAGGFGGGGMRVGGFGGAGFRGGGFGGYRAVGCEACGNTGYLGRTGIYELLTVDDEMRLLVHQGANDTDVRRLAEQRAQARAKGDFDLADDLRQEIVRLGWEVQDVADGYRLIPKT